MKILVRNCSIILVLLSANLFGYTIRICYNGSDDGNVLADDAITVGSVIHGGSACWAPNFSETIHKGEFKDIAVNPAERHNPEWNCHLVPETANGQTVYPVNRSWPLFNLQGPASESLGETWQIKKSTPFVAKMPSLGLLRTIPTSFTINWFADIQEGLHDCKVFAPVTKAVMPQKESKEAIIPPEIAPDIEETALPEAEKEFQKTVVPELYLGPSWWDWSKRMGIYALLAAGTYLFARNMPGQLGNRIRAFESLVGTTGKAIGGYFYNAPQENLEFGIEPEDIMSGQGMGVSEPIGGEIPEAPPVPDIVELRHYNALPSKSGVLTRKEVPQQPLETATTVKPPEVQIAPVMQTSEAHKTYKAVPRKSMKQGESSTIIKPEVYESVVLQKPEQHEAEVVAGGARARVKNLSRREQEAILHHISRKRGTQETKKSQPWVEKVRY